MVISTGNLVLFDLKPLNLPLRQGKALSVLYIAVITILQRL